MIATVSFWFSRALAAVAVLAASSGFANADWVTLKNNTRQTIVVQETVMVNGQPKRSKPTSLLPGESLREFVPTPTVKRIELFDSQNANQPLWSGNLNCKDENQAFAIVAAGAKVAVKPIPASPPPKK